MDKLVLFLLLSLIIISVLILINVFKKEQFKDLDLNESDKSLRLYDVLNFLGRVGLPIELQAAYTSTLVAKDPSQQPDLDNYLNNIKTTTLIVSPENIKENIENIPLSNKGLISSLNTLRAHVHALKIFKAYNDYNLNKLNYMI